MPGPWAPHASARRLALTDGAAICSFVVVGLVAHGDVSATGLVRGAGSLLAGWFAAALAVGAYRTGSLGRLLAAWAIGVPAGVILRAVLLGRSAGSREATFLAVAMTFTLLLLLGFRGVTRRLAA